MCTTIGTTARITGNARAADGWMAVDEARITYDHATRLWADHALRIDLASGSAVTGPVAIELDLPSARRLAAILAEVLDAAEGVERREEDRSDG